MKNFPFLNIISSILIIGINFYFYIIMHIFLNISQYIRKYMEKYSNIYVHILLGQCFLLYNEHPSLL